MRVLVVPPEVAELAALQAWIGEREVRLEPASSCSEAATSLARTPCDLVVCDATRGAGVDLLRDVRARGIAVPFILLTPGSAEEIAHRVRTLGGGFCVPARSLTATAFAEAASRALGSRSAARASPPAARELAPAMLWRTGPDGAFTQFTLAWCRFTGRPEEKERGSGWIAGLHPDNLDRWLDCFGAAVEAEQPFEVDLQLRRADGVYRYLRFRGVPRRADDGSFVGFLGSSFDVSDLVEARAETAAEVSRLLSANSDLEQFASAAAHDLDEPLRTLEQALQQVAEGDDDQLELARSSARRMRALVRDLLECTLVGASDSRMERVDLSTPLDWALENLDRRIRESGAEVTRDALPVVRCDPVQLARAFQNLIGNAIRFRSEDAPRIHVSAETSRYEVVISVRDNAVGIDSEDHERIFEPFKRVHARPAAPAEPEFESGSGLGLALCKRVAERHGGRIRVESEPGKGSTFLLALKT